MLLVRKRNKTIEQFQREKIENAIQKAFESCNKEVDRDIIQCVEETFDINSDKTIGVEEIQDIVEDCLMASSNTDVAKAYIIYRYNHKIIRESQSKLVKNLKKKLSAEDVQNQNANVDEYSFGGRMGEATRLVTKQYALDYCMSRKSRNNHLNNYIYQHDLDSYAVGMHNCLSIPIDDLLANGFNTRQCYIRKANSLNTAFQLLAVVFQLQSLQQFGGVSYTHVDWTLVPYFRFSFYKHFRDGMKYCENSTLENELTSDEIKDNSIDSDYYTQHKKAYQYALDMTLKELKQGVEGMYHNLNTLQSRSGCQLPFTSINYGTCTLTEGRYILKAILQGSINGVGKYHLTPIFPCGIFQCMKGVNRHPGDPNYDIFKLALESTSKRIYPNYVNVDWSVNEGYDRNDPRTYTATMGCRTYNGYDINGLGQIKDGRGNLAPVTIILPTLAMELKQNLKEGDDIVKKFMSVLDKKIFEAKDMLLERYEILCKQSPKSASFMWENNTMYGYKPEEGIQSALKHGTLAIGQIALAETLQILIGKDQTTDEGMELAKKIEGLFQNRCKEFKEEYKLNFGVYYTPAENLCYTAFTKFKNMFGEVDNVTNIIKVDEDGTITKTPKSFFTNSIHVPVWKELTPFEKIDIESQLTNYSNAGCITYVELPSGASNNIEALETIVNYAMDKDIPYFAINIPLDSCDDCGYQGEVNDTCPECGSHNISQLRRVTGYLTGNYKCSFNLGKQDETENRVKHMRSI